VIFYSVRCVVFTWCALRFSFQHHWTFCVVCTCNDCIPSVLSRDSSYLHAVWSV